MWRSERCRPTAVVCSRVVGPIALSLALLLVGGGSLQAVGDPLGSSCYTTANTYLNPSWMTVGDRVNVRSLLRFGCPDRQHGYHLMIVVDVAAVSQDGPDAGTVGHLVSLIDRLESYYNPRVWVGVVGYGPGEWARVLCPITNDIESLKACTRQSLTSAAAEETDWRNAMSEGIREGAKSLILARRADPLRPGDDPLEEGMLVVSRPRPDHGCPAVGACPACTEAREAEALGIEVSSACLGGRCADSCLPRLASADELYYGKGDFERAKDDQADRAWATELRVRTATVRELLDRHVVLQEDSLDPGGADYDPERHLIVWDLDAGRQNESILAYAAYAYEPGRWPVRSFGHGMFEDSHGQQGNFLLPEQLVTVTTRDIVQIVLPWLSVCSGDRSHTFAAGR